MSDDDADLLVVSFAATVIEWRGPAPFYFAAVPAKHVGEVRYAARQASYGWGVVPVEARIGAVTFRTSLFPKDDGYLLPLKAAVRRSGGIALGDPVVVCMRIRAPSIEPQNTAKADKRHALE